MSEQKIPSKQLLLLLREALQALSLDASDTQEAQLLLYLQQLQQWNKVYNLTAVRNIDDMLVQHVIDCLAIINPIKNQVFLQRSPHDAIQVLDVGSGAGLPAIVIAVMMPQWVVTSVDAVAKKMSFVQQVGGVLKLKNLLARHSRVEQMQGNVFNLIVSRAFSSLENFVQLTDGLLAANGCWCAMKGKLPQEELAESSKGVDVFHVEQLDVPLLNAERHLIWMQHKKQQ